MKKLFKIFTPVDIIIYCVSILAIIIAPIAFRRAEVFSIIGSIMGISSLMFNSKGNLLGQIFIILFSVFYGIVSYSRAYYGEMITYLGMTTPIAIWALISWMRHPAANKAEVEVNSITKLEWLFFSLGSIAVTVAFYFILKALNTANLIFSTISVLTSFMAAYLTARRSRFYAVLYALNDVVLIILWVLASLDDISSISMVICFATFLALDIYGFVNWSKMTKRQRAEKSALQIDTTQQPSDQPVEQKEPLQEHMEKYREDAREEQLAEPLQQPQPQK